MTLFEYVQAVASVATAVGVAIAAWQLALSQRQAKTDFEDRLVERYQQIVARLPLAALLGRPLPEVSDEQLRAFYDYFELSNEQAFLFHQRRIRQETWQNWREGIVQHMARPAFGQAWESVEADLQGSFDELRGLLVRPTGRALANTAAA